MGETRIQDLLAEYMAKTNCSPSELSDKIGFSRTTLLRILKGNRISMRTRRMVQDFLDTR